MTPTHVQAAEEVEMRCSKCSRFVTGEHIVVTFEGTLCRGCFCVDPASIRAWNEAECSGCA